MGAPPWNGEILPDSRSSYMRRKLRQGIQNSKPDNVGVKPLKCTTSITYQAIVIFIISVGLFGKTTSFELHTEKTVKVVRGRNVSLICSFTDPADAVYWYKHNSTGAPDDDAELVASEFLGISDPLPGIERFRITEDYRLLISEVSIADETTYSCLVALQTGLTRRGYTDLKVIVLADSLGPRIDPCNTFVPGECTYNVPTNPPEEVVFVCELCGVRPLVNLTWVRSDDRVMEQALGPLIVEKDGLYDVVSILKIRKSGFDYSYLCQATGDAVNNASSTKVTFEERTVPDGLVSLSSAAVTAYVFLALFIMISIVLVILIRRRYSRLSRGEYEKNKITLNMLKRKVEELSKERERKLRNKAKFEEQRLVEAGFQMLSLKRTINSEKAPSVPRSISCSPLCFSETKFEIDRSTDNIHDRRLQDPLTSLWRMNRRFDKTHSVVPFVDISKRKEDVRYKMCQKAYSVA